MDNSGIDLRLNEFSDITRSTGDQNKKFDCLIEAFRTEIKELKTQINYKNNTITLNYKKQQEEIFELKTQNIEFKSQIKNLV